MKKPKTQPKPTAKPPDHDDELRERESEAKELRNNKVLMYFSVFLTLVSFVAFLWLVGVLDWRGSEGKLKLIVRYGGCEDEYSIQNLHGIHSVSIDLRGEVVMVGNHHTLGPPSLGDKACKYVLVESYPAPLEVTDFSGTKLDVTPTFDKGGWSSEGGMEFPVEKILDREHNDIYFGLRYKRKSVMEFTGLSERGFSLIHNCSKCKLSVETPEGFPIVESSMPPRESPWNEGALWTFQSPDGEVPPFRLKMRNDRLYRMDHIIDSSIAALLGVAVGGIVNAYLALILLRRSHKYAEVIRAAAHAKTVPPVSEGKH